MNAYEGWELLCATYGCCGGYGSVLQAGRGGPGRKLPQPTPRRRPEPAPAIASSRPISPMRDGARLYTVVFVPRDISETHAYPILMERTP